MMIINYSKLSDYKIKKNIEFIEPITLVNYSPPINVFGKKEDIVCNILSDLKRKRDIDNDIELLNNIKHIRYNDITSVKNIQHCTKM